MIKFLICGNNAELVDKFFSLGIDDARFLSTTENPEDIKLHMELFQPDAFLYCPNFLGGTQLENLKESFKLLGNAQKAFYAIGEDADLDLLFNQYGTKIKETISINLGQDKIFEKVKAIVEEIKNGNSDSVIHESKSKFANFMDNNDLDPSMLETLAKAAAHAVHASDIGKVNERKKIMIIDDDPNVLRTIRNYLQDQYMISVASSGRVALKFLEDKTVDLILLDYMMPEMEGPLVLNCIRQSPATRDIPVVFLTGVSDKNKIQQILDMNIQGYLLKPVDAQKLMECVHNALQEN